ncbi:MAG: hemagglutinin repeat-containing protein, partial [Campylobacteraceae bacterium]|nr:hemagglutinin repeat-containing protein [Campylobacteraceae bacterium]
INIQDVTNKDDIQESHKHLQTDISLTLQNEYIEIASSIKAAKESAEQLERVRNDYSDYKKEIKGLENTLSELKQKYTNKEAGITKKDIEDLQYLIDSIKDQEKYYLAAITAASLDLAAKTASIASQAASALSSSETLGFSAGLALDLEGSQTDTNTKSSTSISSNLNAKDIILITNINDDMFTSVNIKGSNLIADNNLDIQTTVLNILSGINTNTVTQDTEDISGSISASLYGVNSGMGVYSGYGQSNYNAENIYHTLSHVYSGNNMNIYVRDNAYMEGTVLRGDNEVNIFAGEDLNLVSVTNSYSSNSKGFNAGAGFGLGSDSDYTAKAQEGHSTASNVAQAKLNQQVGLRTGDGLGSTNANYQTNSANYQEKQVILSSITGNKVNIETGGNTNLNGALIAAGYFDENNNFIDNGQLSLTTDTITYSSLSSTLYSNSNSFGMGTNTGFGETYKEDSEGNKCRR